MSKRMSFVDELPQMDRRKAMKLVVYGLVIGIICGGVMMASRSLSAGSTAWHDMTTTENNLNYYNGNIGYNDWQKRDAEIDYQRQQLVFQYVIVGNIARVGINLGLVLMILGFLAMAVNAQTDEKTRSILLTIAGVILIVVILTTFFSTISISFT